MEEEKFEKIIALIANQLELTNDFSKKFIREALNSIIKFDKKHTEKGFGEFQKFGAFGVVVRIDEKYQELLENYKNGNTSQFPKEILEKDWEDIAVYALMGKLIEEGEWKND